MEQTASTLWLLDAQPARDCGGCLTTEGTPVCRSQLAVQACGRPQLAGDDGLLQQVLQALHAGVVDPASGRGIVELQWVRTLRIGDGEADLVLGFAPSCGPGRTMTEHAFQTLRRLLPDTDVYVRHGD